MTRPIIRAQLLPFIMGEATPRLCTSTEYRNCASRATPLRELPLRAIAAPTPRCIERALFGKRGTEGARIGADRVILNPATTRRPQTPGTLLGNADKLKRRQVDVSRAAAMRITSIDL